MLLSLQKGITTPADWPNVIVLTFFNNVPIQTPLVQIKEMVSFGLDKVTEFYL